MHASCLGVSHSRPTGLPCTPRDRPPRYIKFFSSWRPLSLDHSCAVRYVICKNIPIPDLILSPETCLGSFGSLEVSRSSLVFLQKEILTPKSLRLQPPKFFSDIVESILGAVSNFRSVIGLLRLLFRSQDILRE